MLIVIFLQKISKHEMQKSLLRLWNKVTCLESKDTTDISNLNGNEDSLFWKRLFEALHIHAISLLSSLFVDTVSDFYLHQYKQA
jgi:hypothetical protein